MDYVQIEINCSSRLTDMLIASLLPLGYDGFEETEQGLKAYIKAQSFDKMILEQTLAQFNCSDYQKSALPDQNWNAQWESNFNPIEVGHRCYIRATFHQPRPDFEFELVIDPKMAFGTGHHQTTRLMIAHLLDTDLQDKAVMDAGCGTGVLSILAEKLGAQSVLAYDIDSWAVENTRENLELNKCQNIEVAAGTISNITGPNAFDIILANINLNVLLAEIPEYVNHLNSSGSLILSGFYIEDVPKIVNTCEANHLQLKDQRAEEGWVSLIFKRC